MIALALFKLKAQNLVFWLVAPSLVAKAYYNGEVDERIENLWKVHTNRVDRGNIKFSIHRSGRNLPQNRNV